MERTYTPTFMNSDNNPNEDYLSPEMEEEREYVADLSFTD